MSSAEYNHQWHIKNRTKVLARHKAMRDGTLIRTRRSPNEPVTKDFIIIRCRFDYANNCWEWQGAISGDGYGIIDFNGKQSCVLTRVVWQIWNGAIPDGMLVCHHCDHPSCCNPAHLFLGTQKDNARDSILKFRHISQKPHARCFSFP